MEHAYAVTAWALSLQLEFRADCLKCLSTNNGDLRKLINEAVSGLNYPPCTNKKVMNKNIDEIVRDMLKDEYSYLSDGTGIKGNWIFDLLFFIKHLSIVNDQLPYQKWMVELVKLYQTNEEINVLGLLSMIDIIDIQDISNISDIPIISNSQKSLNVYTPKTIAYSKYKKPSVTPSLGGYSKLKRELLHK